LICLTLCNCAVFQKSGLKDESRQHLNQGQNFLAQGDFDASLRENQKVLLLSPDSPPGDEALFNIGLIYAHPGNSERNSAESIAYLQRLIREFPESPWREKAKVCIEIIGEYEKSRQTLAEVIRDRAKFVGENKRIAGDNVRLREALAGVIEENEKSKQAQAAAAQENVKLKSMIDEWKRVDRELEGKRRGKAR
jgi:tetratricopeptide (TPR) repeat protein